MVHGSLNKNNGSRDGGRQDTVPETTPGTRVVLVETGVPRTSERSGPWGLGELYQ